MDSPAAHNHGFAKTGISIFLLKLIAYATMLIDHTASSLVPSDTLYHTLMRAIGRIAFPIFVFCLVEGALNTRSIKKYALRLLIFALLSEIPFDLGLYHSFYFPYHQNVIFTLLLGLLLIAVIIRVNNFLNEHRSDLALEKNEARSYRIKNLLLLALIVGCVVVSCAVSEILCFDYGAGGILLIVSMYVFRKNKPALAVAAFVIFYLFYEPDEMYAVFAFIPIFLYSGKRGIHNAFTRCASYLFYPVHLLILGIISILSTGELLVYY